MVSFGVGWVSKGALNDGRREVGGGGEGGGGIIRLPPSQQSGWWVVAKSGLPTPSPGLFYLLPAISPKPPPSSFFFNIMAVINC